MRLNQRRLSDFEMIGMGRWKSVEASVLYRSESKSKSVKFPMWEAEHGGCWWHGLTEL